MFLGLILYKNIFNLLLKYIFLSKSQMELLGYNKLTRKHVRGGQTNPDESYEFTNQNIT